MRTEGKAAMGRMGIIPAGILLEGWQDHRRHWDGSSMQGRLAELSGKGATARLTLAFSLVLDVQGQGEPVAWITGTESSFYPPDAAAGGVDLDALVVVRVAGSRRLLRAADHLARSGAFGLLVIDLDRGAHVPLSVQTRLAGLASRYATGILCLTEKTAREASLGSLISFRGEALREAEGAGRFLCRMRALKDKRQGPGWGHAESCNGPDGLR